MARLARLVVAAPLAALAAGCPSAGDGDDYPIGGGGAGGGTSGPTSDGGGPGGDGGVDAQASIRGRVCLLTDLRRLTGELPGDCAATGAGSLRVALGAATALTAADGAFELPAQEGTNLAWRVSGLAIVTSVVPVSASALLPAIADTAYGDLKSASGVIVAPGEGAVIARLLRGGAPVTGATAQIVGGESLQTLYDGATPTVWATGGTGALGVAWLPDNVAGARTLRIAYGSPQATLSLPVGIVDQAITFVTIALP